MRYALIDKNTGQVYHIGDKAIRKESGIDVGGLIFSSAIPLVVVAVEEVPADVKPYEYFYSEEQGFYKDPNYQQPMTTEEKLERTQQELEIVKRLLKQLSDDTLAFMEDVLSRLP